jgi:lipid-binding SYLF domain-containing protein
MRPETEETLMIRIMLAATALGMLALLSPRPAYAQSDEQTLVDRSTLALQEMVNQTVSDDPRRMLSRARAVLICPRVFKAGFFFGGEGGACVLLARAGNGTWSYPAFYGMGSGSFGLQIGIQDAEFVMMIMTQRGLNAILDSQFKIGADASLAIATIGAGVQGDTTTALGADIIAFSQTRGLYGGISLQGSVMGQRISSDQAYYGHDIGARQIIIDMQASNPGADPLRDVLTRYGAGESQQAAVPPPPPSYAQPNYASPGAGPVTPAQPAAPGPVQQQTLPPPR